MRVASHILAALLDFAARHDLWVISDEVYEYFTFTGPLHQRGEPGQRRPSLQRVLALQDLRPHRRPGRLPGHSARGFRHVPRGPGSDRQLREHAGATCRRRGHRGYPDGAFYLWINVSYCSRGNVAAWAETFLLTQRVAVAPGSAFGSAGEGWIRGCLAGQQERLLTALSRLPTP